MLRTAAVAIIVSILLVSLAPGTVAGHGYNSATIQSSIQRACSFISGLYNYTLHLVGSTPSSHTYYVSSDNLLAQAALAQCNPTISHSIKTAITQNPCCNQGNDLLHEAILGTQIPFPIQNATTTNVTIYWPNSIGNTILYENHNGRGTLSPYSYADVAVYTAFELDRGGDQAIAVQTVQILNRMWDANGLVDDSFKNGTNGEKGVYQTFKDALYLLALLKTSQTRPANLEQKILNMQGPDGGFNTGYDPNGTYAGRSENTETTSIVILALGALLPPEPWWAIYWYLFLIPIAAAPILLFLLLHFQHRRRRAKRQSVQLFSSSGPTSIESIDGKRKTRLCSQNHRGVFAEG